jgi:predicted nuclease with TOPRIM domain
MMELTKEQIMRAAETLEGAKVMVANRDFDEFQNAIITAINALAIIKELTEENEKLNERLDREARCQYDLCGQIVNLCDDVKYIKEETVHKMQERLKYSLCCIPQCHFTYAEVQFHIDRIAKEMLEGNK